MNKEIILIYINCDKCDANYKYYINDKCKLYKIYFLEFWSW
jgi:hypothetical protein